VQLVCRTPPWKDHIFEIRFLDDQVYVEAGGHELLACDSGEFFEVRAVFPSLAASVRHFRIQLDEHLVEFDCTGEQLDDLKNIRDYLLIQRDPRCHSRVRTRGLLATAGGVILFVISGGLLYGMIVLGRKELAKPFFYTVAGAIGCTASGMVFLKQAANIARVRDLL
jgi:hypothetical protein